MSSSDQLRHAYHGRMLKVVAYIDAHLDGDLTLDVLAGVAAFSKFHFHRQFSALFGLGVGEIVQLARLKRAAYDLAFRARGVLDVALDAGYESPESLARIFKKRFGQTPSEWRAAPDWVAGNAVLAPLHDMRRSIVSNTPNTADIMIVDFPETRVGVLEHHGDPRRLNDTVRAFIAWRREHRLSPQTSATFNILHNDPSTTPPEDYRLDFCAAVRAPVAPNPFGIVERVIPGGRCATFRVVGPDEVVGPMLNRLYREWLPASGEEPRDFPPFLQRVTLFPEVPEHEAIVDVFVPLKS